MMGDPNEPDAPPHEVVLSAFYLDKYLVTQDQFQRVMHENPSRWKGTNNPVEQVRWSDAGTILQTNGPNWKDWSPATISRLGNAISRPAAIGCLLKPSLSTPTERGPRRPMFQEKPRPSFGDIRVVRQRIPAVIPRPIGQKQPNAWGIYDMSGNLWGMDCNDFYQVDYYPSAPKQDPKGPEEGKTKVVRGGSWRATTESCRSGYRYNENPGYADVCFGYDIYGFLSREAIAAKGHRAQGKRSLQGC